MDDLSFDIVCTGEGLQVILHDYILSGGAYLFQGLAFLQCLESLGEALDNGKGVLGLSAVQGQFYYLYGLAAGDHGNKAVIGAGDILAVPGGQQHMISFTVKEIDQHNMKSARGKPGERAFTDVRSLGEVEGMDLMGDVRHMATRAILPQLALDGANQVVLITNV